MLVMLEKIEWVKEEIVQLWQKVVQVFEKMCQVMVVLNVLSDVDNDDEM